MIEAMPVARTRASFAASSQAQPVAARGPSSWSPETTDVTMREQSWSRAGLQSCLTFEHADLAFRGSETVQGRIPAGDEYRGDVGVGVRIARRP
jgi:hypothetical protein